MSKLRRYVLRLLPICAASSLLCLITIAGTASALNYGAGKYGDCTYGTCGITLSSNGVVNINIVPSQTGACTVGSDLVSVLTDNTNGYTLTIQTNGASNALSNGSSTIAAISASQSSPSTLSANNWGYRVDGVSNFGSGPTSAYANAAYPVSDLFAPVPPSTGSADTLATTSVPADPAVTTTVWYGACADTTIPASTYGATVMYTAVAN